MSPAHASIAQLDRATGFEPVGRAFESLWTHFIPLFQSLLPICRRDESVVVN